MKKLLSTLLCCCAAVGLQAQSGREWLDPEINAVNRMEMRASFFAYESAEAAAAGDPRASDRFLDLNGTWRFAWVCDADRRPADFHRVGFDDGAWGVMPVPGLWELNGYGDPLYLNIGYAWREQFPSNPPEVPTAGNHVGSYRREVEIPAAWSGKQVIAHFGSVTSNIYLWVNGRFVGYSEDSKLEAEFDITRFVKPGRNLVAFQVFRWSDGTYLEDQDFFRLSGVGRDCWLYARDKRHVADIRLTPSLTDDYTCGRLDAELTLPAAARGCTAEVTLTAPDGRVVASETAKISATAARLALDAGSVQPWSAEIPALYGVTVTLKDPAGKPIETIPLRTGFREVKIAGGQLLVNGQPVLIKGANRHEMDPDGGYVVSESRMREDIRILKENNFNAVRTCHYPDDARWYDLCDEFGIYLVSEANIESHGMGYGERSLAGNPAYAAAHLERNRRHVKRCINHPSVIVWSLGNEAGDGPNFDACYDWIKNYDPSRPVHYERAIYRNDGRNTDITCPMYWNYDQCREYLASDPQKPLIQCEYAHAMGNSLGGFGSYWRMIRADRRYQGGFIWDFVDQGLRKQGKHGATIYGYGGDWNPYDASDQNFCANGLISPDRVPNPHMHEARYWQQSIWTEAEDAANGRIAIFNENFFRDLSDCSLEWEILRDGEPVRFGTVDALPIGAQQRARLALPYTAAELPPHGELLLNVAYRLKRAGQLLSAGHKLAEQQFVIRAGDAAACFATAAAQTEMAGKSGKSDDAGAAGAAGAAGVAGVSGAAGAAGVAAAVAVRDNDRNFLVVEGLGVRIDFRREDGLVSRYEVGGRPLLDAGAVLEPNFWRAPTDNDFGAGLQRKNRVWADPGLKLLSLDHTADGASAVVTAHYELTRVGGRLTLCYRIAPDGEILLHETLTAGDRTDVPDLMRFGMRMHLPADYDRIDYYGRGPWENYSDRKDGALLRRYRQRVAEQFYPYIRPQETGAKSDVRRWRQCDASGRGIELTASAPFSASALHHAQEALDEGLGKRQGHSQEITPDRAVWLCFDKAQAGLGCIDSWGALPEKEHRLTYGDYEFTVRIRPTGKR